MVAALLHGRTHLNFQEFRQQNHLTFFLHVLGVLELLQPQVFQSEHQGALWDCLLSFIRLLLVGLARPLPLGSLPSSSPRAPSLAAPTPKRLAVQLGPFCSCCSGRPALHPGRASNMPSTRGC